MTTQIEFQDVPQIASTDATPLGKIKVYAGSDLKFYNKSPKKIVWENNGNTVVAVFPVKESKSTQPNYKITCEGHPDRLVPVFQVIKSLESNPPSSIIAFDVTDFVRPI